MYNSDDPRSLDYKRIYNKTPINWKRFAIILIINFIIILISFLIYNNILFLLLIEILYLGLVIKYLLILMIKIYQKIAPINIRSKCRFEPSCSNYMLICLEKYGFFKGFKKGIIRIKRCNINDGGYDYP